MTAESLVDEICKGDPFQEIGPSLHIVTRVVLMRVLAQPRVIGFEQEWAGRLDIYIRGVLKGKIKLPLPPTYKYKAIIDEEIQNYRIAESEVCEVQAKPNGLEVRC